MAVKKGRYQINMDVLLFPWKLTYKNHGSGLVPKGSFGKVHLAQDTTTRKRMACKLVSLPDRWLEIPPVLDFSTALDLRAKYLTCPILLVHSPITPLFVQRLLVPAWHLLCLLSERGTGLLNEELFVLVKKLTTWAGINVTLEFQQ